MKFFRILICLFLLPFAVFAATESVKAYKNEKYKYLLNAPEKWTTQEIKDSAGPIKLNLLSEDKKISLMVMVSDRDQKTTALDFLKSMESSRSLKNKLKPEQIKVSGDSLKKWNVTEAVRAQYETKGKGPNFPVAQKTLVLKKEKFIYALIFAYPKSEEAKLKTAIENIEASFKAE